MHELLKRTTIEGKEHEQVRKRKRKAENPIKTMTSMLAKIGSETMHGNIISKFWAPL